MLTVSDIRKCFPEFDCLKDSVIELAIEEAECMVSTAFADTRDLAMKYYIAHDLELSRKGDSGGIVTQEKVGDLSRSYSVDTSNDDSYYRQTQYGLKYLNIRGSIVTSPFLID